MSGNIIGEDVKFLPCITVHIQHCKNFPLKLLILLIVSEKNKNQIFLNQDMIKVINIIMGSLKKTFMRMSTVLRS